MTDPSCDVANLLTPDRFWKSVDKRGRNFAGLAGVCRARPGRGRPIVCPVERTQRGIIPRRVTYTAAKPNRAGWIAYEYLAGDSRDDPWTRSCSTILNLAGKSDSWTEDGQTMEISLLKRIFASILPLLRILLRIAWIDSSRFILTGWRRFRWRFAINSDENAEHSCIGVRSSSEEFEDTRGW